MCKHKFGSVFVLTASLLLPSQAAALQINLSYLSQNNSETPTFDPFGFGIVAQTLAAANHWESIIQTNHTLNIQMWYDDLNENVLANALPLTFTDNRVSVGRIRYDTRDDSNALRNWWFDNTPNEDEEFRMEHVSYAQANSASSFAGAPLGGLEIGYRGVVFNGPAANNFDFQSVALHEIGHLLGLAGIIPDAAAETMDGDYDLPPSLMNGHVSAVRTAIGDIAHIRPGTALMCGSCASESTRVRPSAVDILAAATVGNWNNIDLPRKMFVAGTDFNASSGWLDSQAPNSSDDAYVSDGGSFFSPVELTASDVVGSLSVLGTYLSTGNNFLNVNGQTLVDRPDVAFASLRIPESGALITESLLVRSGSLAPQGGTVSVSGDLTLESGSNLQGHGVIDVDGTLNNNGIIRTSGDETLTLSSSSSLDLDGTSGNGELEVLNGDLLVEDGLADPFDDRLNVGNDYSATFLVPWILGTSGELRTSGLSGTGTLAGAEVTVRGDVVVSQTMQIDAPVILESSAEIRFQTGTPPMLLLNGQTTYRGVSILSGGEIVQNGDAVIETTTNIAADLYDWDGTGKPSDTLVNNATLQISASQLESGDPALNGYGGTATLNNAGLLVTTDAPWRLDGTVVMDSALLRGQTILNHGEIRGSGTIQSSGLVNDGQVNAKGGTLLISPIGSFPDLDGIANNGELETLTGSLHVTGNPGALELFQGTLRIAKTYEFRMDFFGLQNQGLIALKGGTYQAPSLFHQGMLTAQASSSTLLTSVTFGSSSTTTIDSVELIVDGSAEFDPAANITGTGTLRFAFGTTAFGEANIEVDVRNAGNVNPGSPNGRFRVLGNFDQLSTGSITFDIAGTLAEEQYDQLSVDGILSLDGTLIVDLAPGFLPAAGNVFDLFNFGAIQNQFDTLQLDSLPSGLFWNTSLLYSTGVLSIVDLTADFDNDGDVDAQDLAQWQSDFGGPGSDADGDGDSDGADFLAWQREFGYGVGPLAASEAVPEPSAALLLVSLFILVRWGKLSRKRQSLAA